MIPLIKCKVEARHWSQRKKLFMKVSLAILGMWLSMHKLELLNNKKQFVIYYYNNFYVIKW